MMAMVSMERVTVRVEPDDLDRVEKRVERGQFPNRSEAIREAIRLLDECVEMPSDKDREESR